MRLPSFSIAALMCVVAIAAVDAYLIRQMDLGEENAEILGAAGIFVMVQVLGEGLLRIISSREKPSPFLLGFEVGGTLAILAYLGCFRLWTQQMEDLFVTARWPIEVFCDAYAPGWVSDCFYQNSWDAYPDYLKYPMLFAVLPFMTVFLLLGQLLIALAGGWTARVLFERSWMPNLPSSRRSTD